MALYGDSQLGSIAFDVGPFPAAMLMHQVGVIHGAVLEDVQAGRLVEVRIVDKPELHSEIGLVSLPDRSLSPSARCVVGAIVVEMAKTVVSRLG